MDSFPKIIAEEGPLQGLVLTLEGGPEWVLGRDPDLCQLIVEDLKVSRQHARFKAEKEGIFLSNLSHTNPVTIQDKPLSEPHLLKEDDLFRIGSNLFRFSTAESPAPLIREKEETTLYQAPQPLIAKPELDLTLQQRWLLKVISGPQSGAEFSMEKGHSYLIGSDPSLCDILFYDLSVSKKHALLTITEEDRCFIEDQNSRNGILINGQRISQKQELLSQELISLGTSSFVVIDREKASQTIVAPSLSTKAGEVKKESSPTTPPSHEDLQPSSQVPDKKEPLILTWIKRYPIWSALIGGGALVFLIGTFSLFHTTTHMVPQEDVSASLAKILNPYPDVTYTFNTSNGHLFLVGHVLTATDKVQLEYALKNLPFIAQIDDANVLVDQYIWQEMNALLAKNASWNGVSMYASSPGVFTLTGYLRTRQEAAQLMDYLNLNFSYLDRLQNRVIVEEDLYELIQSQLLSHGFNGVTVAISNGEVTLSGFIPANQLATYAKLLQGWKDQTGIRNIKNFVVTLTPSEAVVNLSDRYQVTGFTIKNSTVISVVINGMILSRGDTLDGMTIVSIQSNVIFLEKDGLKFKINYNS